MAWMSDAEYELRKDCMEKKITARSARSTRTHCGKSGAVKFPSDYMTEKEKRAMNGECKSYRMNDPITYKEFKTWPDEHKKTYIKLLRSKYNVPDKDLAEAMGVSKYRLGILVRELNLGLGKGAAAAGRWWKGSADERAFREWWYGTCEEADDNVDVCDEETVEETVTDELIAVNEDANINVIVDPKEVANEMKYSPSNVITQKDVQQAAELLNKTWTEMSNKNEDDTCSINIGEIHICDNSWHRLPVIPNNGSMTFVNNTADDVLDTIRSLLSGGRVNMTVSWEFVGGNDA